MSRALKAWNGSSLSKTFTLKIPDMSVLPLFGMSMGKDGLYKFVSPI
jgi:hypothetical protein